jgi:hypothetical protein
MSDTGDHERATLHTAERIVGVLASEGVDAAIIGAVALAAHHYPRSTEDLDLAVGVDPERLPRLANALRAEGFSIELREPDAADPLGGVLRVTAEGSDPIEIVNFCNPPSGGIPALIEAALQAASPYREGSALRVVSLRHLVAFKLYSGGLKSKTDVLELLSRNPWLDLNELRETCAALRLDRRLDAWLGELGRSAEE